MMFQSWGDGALDPVGIFVPVLHSKDRGNFSGFAKCDVDALLDAADTETDVAKRSKMYQERRPSWRTSRRGLPVAAAGRLRRLRPAQGLAAEPAQRRDQAPRRPWFDLTARAPPNDNTCGPASSIERILQLIPVLLGVSLIVFVMMTLTPGDPVEIMLGDARAEPGAARQHASRHGARPAAARALRPLSRQRR